MSRYSQAKADMEFLESIAELDDWVSIHDEMRPFMDSPTKAKAADLFESAIGRWFSEHGTLLESTHEIAERHGIRPAKDT